MFVGTIEPCSNHRVATIGGKGHSASGLGTVRWTWHDDYGKTHEYLVEGVLYFPQSPINILSVTSFARQLNDKEGTGIDTKMAYSRFYWDKGRYQRIIRHPASNLPEMSINEGFSLATMYRAFVSRVINPAVKPEYSCHFTHLDSDDHCCESRCGCTGHEAFSTAAVIDNPAEDPQHEQFEIGETLFYSNCGHSTMVKLKSFQLDGSNVLRLTVVTSNGEEITTTKEHLRSPTNPDIGWIPTSTPELESAARHLTDEQIEEITLPMHLSPLQQEFLSRHCQLLHLPFSTMLRMSKIGLLPSRFLKLRNDLPPCVSCMFGQSHCRPWKGKGSSKASGGVLKKESINEPGQTVGTDQIVSAQPGFVPQEKGQLTRARIWGATIFVDYATK